MKDLKIKDRGCVVCGTNLTGRQVHFCSEACKQAAKYQQVRGLRCSKCKRPMPAVKVLGGFRQSHKRCPK